MKLQLIVRRFAGVFILLSLVLAQVHSRYWLWFTAFVGFNLLQSSFTNFCPLELALRNGVTQSEAWHLGSLQRCPWQPRSFACGSG